MAPELAVGLDVILGVMHNTEVATTSCVTACDTIVARSVGSNTCFDVVEQDLLDSYAIKADLNPNPSLRTDSVTFLYFAVF